MIRLPPRSTPLYSSAASDVYKRQFRKYLKRFYKCTGVLYEIRCTIKVCKHPFMRIKNKTADIFLTLEHPLKFGQNKGCTCHSTINMKPHFIFIANLTYCF